MNIFIDVLHQQDARPFRALPVEIFAEIVGQLIIHSDASSLKPNLSALALTCRNVRLVVLPHQFKSLQFVSVNPKGFWSDFNQPEPWVEPLNVGFCRSLNDGDPNAIAIAPYVKQCTVQHWLRNSLIFQPSPRKQQCLAECMLALTAMPNLEKLSLLKNELTIESVESIAKMKKLKSLKMEYRALDHDSVVANEGRLQSLRILRLRSLCCSGGHEQTLICRYLSTRGLKVFSSENWSFTKHVLSLKPTIQLEELEILTPLYKPDIVWKYLSETPSIIHLSLTRQYEDLPYVCHPPSFLPNLRVLRCSLPIAKLFTAVPMKHLMIVGYFSDSSVLDSEGLVFPHVEELTFPLACSEATLAACFPRLKKYNRSKV